jgi:hypothetical protein
MISETRTTWGVSINRRSTRRWIVAGYWLMTAFFAFAMLMHSIRHHGSFASMSLVYALFWLPAFLGGVRAGGAVKPFRKAHFPMEELRNSGMISLFERGGQKALSDGLDEREMRLRDRVHFVSYTVTRWLALAFFGLYALISAQHPEWLQTTGPVFLFVLVLVMWGLPQSIILWNEPDVEVA